MINRIFNWTAGSFFRTLGRFVFYGLITAIIVFLFSIFNAKAAEFVPEFYTIRGGSYSGTIMASSQSSTKNIYVCQPGTYCIMTMSFFLDTDTNYNNQSISTTLEVCSGVDNFPRDFDSSNTGTVSTGYVVSYENIGTCSLYGQRVQRQRLKIVWTPTYNYESNGNYSNLYLNSLWSSYNSYGVEVAFQILSVQNEIYTSDMASQDVENQQNQEIINQQQQTNEQLGDMNDYIQDDTPASTDDIDMDSLGTVSGLLPEGPVDSLLNIPFTFLSVLTSSMGGVCVPITGTFVFDSTLSIPCFDSFYDEVPDYLMNFINLIPAGFILIMYFKHLYKKVERAVSLQTTTDDEWGVI